MASSFRTALGAISGWSGQTVTGRGERLRLALGGTAAVSLAAHAFSYFNFMPQHDALIESFWQNTGWVISLGRFLLPVYRTLAGSEPMPWVTGMLSTLYIALAVYCISGSLAMNTRGEILLTAGFMTANLSVLTINALYQFVFDAYMFAFLLACLGVYILHDAASPGRIALAAACFFLSVGVYPAMITGALCLFMLCFLRCAAEENAVSPALWRRFGAWAVSLAAAAAMYLLCSRLALGFFGVSAADKNTSIFSLDAKSIRDILYGIGVNTYFFYAILFLGVSPVHATAYLGPVYGAAAEALALSCVASSCRRNRGALRGWVAALFFPGVILFPVFARLVNIVAASGTAHHTAYAQFLAYPALLWAFFFRAKKKDAGDDDPGSVPEPGNASVCLVLLLSLILILANIRFSNSAYTLQKVIYDRAMYHSGQVAEDLKDAGYSASDGEQVVVVGTFSLGGELSGKLDRFTQAGLYGFNDTSVTYNTTFRYMLRTMGIRINMVSVGDTADPDALGRLLEDMPAYPKEGYLQKSDSGLYVIKLS